MTQAKQNSALNLMWAIGGIFATIIQTKAEAKDIAEFQRKDAKDNPVPKRVHKLLRQYNKRYTHILSGVTARINLEALQRAKAG